MEAEFYSFIPCDLKGLDSKELVKQAVARHAAEGAVWARVMQVDANHNPTSGEVFGYWVEGWLERPTEDPEFKPPLTERTNEAG